MSREETKRLPVSRIETLAAYAVSYIIITIGGGLVIYSVNLQSHNLLISLAGFLVMVCGTVTGYVTGDLMNMYYTDPPGQVYEKGM